MFVALSNGGIVKSSQHFRFLQMYVEYMHLCEDAEGLLKVCRSLKVSVMSICIGVLYGKCLRGR